MSDIVVDDRQWQSFLLKLSSKKFDRSTRRAMIEGARILQKSARSSLSAKVRNTGKKKFPTWPTMQSGVRVSTKNEDVKVHIMGEFRLKFFEKGVAERHWKRVSKKGSHKSTGPITATHFFQIAQQHSSQAIFSKMDRLIGESLDKVAK